MTYRSTFAPETLADNLARLDRLRPDTRPQWGKMNAAQMLAHLNVAYDMETGAVVVKNNFISRFLIRTFAKSIVTGPKPYKKNSRTAPQFIISDERDFAREKEKLIGHLKRVAAGGEAGYEGKENESFGKLSAEEWSTMYQKHLEHHFAQFGL
ncbi:hypothetical protein LEM8419_03344 [Neolewinella maritima]|uniref:DUF1569 domain-containing protein n=1 Tax=Neolewinella maritima TaxID=1383882 RepID=A0ABN8FAX5_9BACT|nr:DUF1569 domain-containing protein [Neolewinella maritima]CAH1002465.1 hypothetical protein LEM8419_03344 [Neolewinella maritima]